MRMDFNSENKVNNYDGFPKLSLEAGERARVAVLEAPLVVYKHSINKPVIDPETGEIAKQTVKSKNGEYEKDHYEYVNAYVCTGDVEKVYNDPDHIDPDNCLLCKAVTDYPGKFSAPKPYYLAHAIKYKLKQGTLNPQDPFQVDLVLWSLPSRNYNALIEISEEHGDVRKKDLLLTDCTNKTYQNYKIGAGSDAYWLSDPQRQATVAEIFKSNKADDATVKKTAGKQQTPVAVQNDINVVLERWALHGKVGSASPMLQGEFGGQVMAGQQAAAQAETPAWDFSAPAGVPAAAPQSGGMPDFLTDQSTAQQAPAAQPQPIQEAPQQQVAQAPAPAPQADTPSAGQSSGELSFEDLMNGI